MGVNSKAIKQRIKSVKNTKKMTKAMELVSAAKMRKAVGATLNTRVYATLARELMLSLAGADKKSPLLAVRPVKKNLLILISSNRGMCGSFNSNVFKKAHTLLKAITDTPIDVIGVGKKSSWFARKFGHNLIAAFDSLNERPGFQDVMPIARLALNGFIEKTYDRVYVVYTDYKSSLVQEVRLRQLLPITAENVEALLGEKMLIAENVSAPKIQYQFEPSKKAIMTAVLPRLVEIQVYQTVLESAASEHSARMVAMKNASSSAGDMIDGLTLEFNKARQAAITQEIAEIAGGAAALE